MSTNGLLTGSGAEQLQFILDGFSSAEDELATIAEDYSEITKRHTVQRLEAQQVWLHTNSNGDGFLPHACITIARAGYANKYGPP